MENITVSELEGMRVGHAQDEEAVTGCTVFLFPEGCAGGVAVRGGSPGTKDAVTLDYSTADYPVHGVVLTGGSSYGLESIFGVMEFLEEQGIGLDVGGPLVPIVPGAVILDLGIGAGKIRPDKEMGYKAARKTNTNPATGSVGAGIGATVGKLLGMDKAMKGGFGYHLLQHRGVKVGAFSVVNALGNVIDPQTGETIASTRRGGGIITDEELFSLVGRKLISGSHTTLSLVVTDAEFERKQLCRLASVAHDGFARTIKPSHLEPDGDTIFAVSTGEVKAAADLVSSLAVKSVEKSIISAVKGATGMAGVSGVKELQ